MMTAKLNLHDVILPPGEVHPSNAWAANQALGARSSFYPAVVRYLLKPNGSKEPIRFSKEMLHFLESLQSSRAAYEELLWIAGGPFNQGPNAFYLPAKRKANVRYYIPPDGPWPQPPVGEPITTIGNVVNVLEVKNGWARIETLPMKGPWHQRPETHEWLFNKPVRSIRIVEQQTGDKYELGNAIRDEGVIYPLFSRTGQAWIETKWLRKQPKPKESEPIVISAAEPKPTLPASPALLEGKGWYAYILDRIGSPEVIAQRVAESGATHLMMKVADGPHYFNRVKTFKNASGKLDKNYFAKDGVDWNRLVAVELRKYGIQVWGWQYIYGQQPEAEADRALELIEEYGLDGFVVNAEKEFKGIEVVTAKSSTFSSAESAKRARTYSARLRKGTKTLLAFSSFRFPSLHRPIPFEVFLEYVDINMPQVYWQGAHNPEAQLDRTLAEYRALKVQRPIVPTGAAYGEHAWRPAPSEVTRFMVHAKQQLGLPAANFWELWHALQAPELFHAVRDLPWGADEPQKAGVELTWQSGNLASRAFRAFRDWRSGVRVG